MSPDAVKLRPKPVRLDYRIGAGQQVVVTPADEDRFVVNVQAAVDACQAYHQSVKFQRQFKETLLPRLALWLDEHRESVERGYVTVREDGLFFVIVQLHAAHDRGIEDDVAALEIEIAQDPKLNLIDLSTITLPNASEALYKSFLAPKYTLAYHRNRPIRHAQ